MSTSSGNSYDVVVIGAGHNGLAAALLARGGRKVIVLEERDVVGGLAASEEFHPGYRSPGVLHDSTGVRHDLIEQLRLEGHGLAVDDTPPSILAPQENGEGLLLHHDPRKAATEISRFSKRDAERYTEYRGFIDRVRDFVNRIFDNPPPDVSALNSHTVWPLLKKGLGFRRLGHRDAVDLIRVMTMSVADWLDEWFETDLLKALLVVPALRGAFVGPRSPGSALNLLLWECRKGPGMKGGPGALTKALAAAAKASGVDIRTGARVTGIRVSDGKVAGIMLDGGETIDGDIVVTACDPKKTFLELVPDLAISEKFAHRIKVFRANGTMAKVDIALRSRPGFGGREGNDISWVRTGDDLTQLEKAFDSVKYGQCSESPVLEVLACAGASSEIAPEGGCVLSVLVQYTPYDLKEGWGDSQRDALGLWVINALSKYIPSLSENIDGLRVLTPLDIEKLYGTTGGHLHHGDHTVDQLFVRPSPECARHRSPVGGLYLCGSGSFPGGGITCAPGVLGAKAILDNS